MGFCFWWGKGGGRGRTKQTKHHSTNKQTNHSYVSEYLYICQINLALNLRKTCYGARRRAYVFNNHSPYQGQNEAETKYLN